MEESVDRQEGANKESEQTLANLSPAEEGTSKDEVEIEKVLQEQKSKSTQYKTKSDLNAWKKFCESQKESVRKQDGTEYEPGALSSFQRSFQRYLYDEKESLIDILRDNEFSKSREVDRKSVV